MLRCNNNDQKRFYENLNKLFFTKYKFSNHDMQMN